MKYLATALFTLFSLQSAPDLERRAAILRPKPGEFKWQQIPWVLDLSEARKQAKEEKRPLLIWASGDDPLERC